MPAADGPTHAWDPDVYLNFAAPRLRPALDLMDATARVEDFDPGRIVDLGCGPGGITRRLARRWPAASVAGIDGDAAMLEKARANTEKGDPEVDFRLADIDEWAATGPAEYDLIYSNAALHWLGDHEALFRGLARRLAPAGILAVQMPDNAARPSHTSIDEVLSERWPDLVIPGPRVRRLSEPEAYLLWLEAEGCVVETWKTEYRHILSGPDPVVAWTRGSALGPILAALPADQHAAFLEAYAARLAHAYPPMPDGRTVFPFRRFFLIARRRVSD